MSLVFNDTVTYRGIVQEYEKECGFEYGDVSGSAILLASMTASVNLALDDFVELALRSEGTWQFDDSNHDAAQGNYPIISTDIISGQRDYPFLSDQYGNLILDIYGVYVANPSKIFVKLSPVDVSTGKNDMDGYPTTTASGQLFYGGLSSFTDGQNTPGTPVRYDKLANGVFLDPVPNYNMRLAQEGVAGLKLYVNREGSYFTISDTSKKPGVPGLFHRYFVVRAAQDYARQNNKANYGQISAEVMRYEGNEEAGIVGSIQAYFSRRSKDERNRVIPGRHNNR